MIVFLICNLESAFISILHMINSVTIPAFTKPSGYYYLLISRDLRATLDCVLHSLNVDCTGMGVEGI